MGRHELFRCRTSAFLDELEDLARSLDRSHTMSAGICWYMWVLRCTLRMASVPSFSAAAW